MAVFADTWFYLALIDERDRTHESASRYAADLDQIQVTTRWVLAELLNAAARGSGRNVAVRFVRKLETAPLVKIIRESDELFEQGVLLYERRRDKDWSLTDCVSFLVMDREGLREALTNDHHFKQAGFVPLFAEAT